MKILGDNSCKLQVDNEKLLHSCKKLKSDVALPDGYGETAYSRIDTYSV
jgi:hypothetical protein